MERRGMGIANLICTVVIALAGPIAIAYSKLCIAPLIVLLTVQFFVRDVRISKHSVDVQHLIPLLHIRGISHVANVPFVLDLCDVCTLTLLPTILAVGIVQPKLIIVAVCMTVINSLTMSHIMLWAKRRRIFQFIAPCYMLISQGVLLMSPHLSAFYARIDQVAIQHWGSLSTFAVPCVVGTYFVVIQRVKYTIIEHPFYSPEVMVKNMGRKK